ncbi:helix-turn-helix transcriptional regulator [Aliirhizobium cellulosilyticum]|uniref:Transcriptional regulator with XRE-family HTH domain n=1 Tax=Aliirhizobium cellulosilyticum TaxID=393664 RepID=A0A7W6UZC3_9HYPH|nr:helix-turn-helix transcriptional regulator [Rhizobium cellulosilyticum]MBB4349280.1 transcriptional regulator with XRE-family HTH domain [Rhizobium cellulosilyticum]MBB4412498.1 transcriptional regulator with XRE-family HTH domain [Rhizobium cellulosilyticum]MBB4447130.1 transcriptional regulator with XRE-family HTH domain [Rhizobium cellulosilyticum]
MIFGVDFSRFRIVREAADMSQAKLADLAGISQGKVSTIEAGKANPETATLNAICAALDAELILVPRRIGGDVRALVDRHLNRPTSVGGPVMSVRDELFIPDGDD